MKKTQLLCDGCVRPITSVPFYKCSGSSPQHNINANVENPSSSSSSSSCGGFVLHEWCAKLPSQLHDHPGHPQHTLLLLLPKAKLVVVFDCEVCRLPSNGFAYGCTTCGYYVDINCSLIPEEITHEAHPNHLLRRIKGSDIPSDEYCKACWFQMKFGWGFHCPSCDFYIHTRCALLLPRQVRHKYDKHPLSLRYGLVENHPQEYFCEICEDRIYSFNSRQWFYHCTTCAWSMHAACVPLILQSEQAVYSEYPLCVFLFLNVKFGGKVEIQSLHRHSLAFVQGIESDGQCSMCHQQLQYRMILNCLECHQFAIHYECAAR
uniref:uncharacterized protein LOC122608472 n=1 Tax=Erigeron canadensis TaxID=72917 RepID=UPI001CB99D60|nr:uncharacterized protein LOC122608472 [Erigeron canadensis]